MATAVWTVDSEVEPYGLLPMAYVTFAFKRHDGGFSFTFVVATVGLDDEGAPWRSWAHADYAPYTKDGTILTQPAGAQSVGARWTRAIEIVDEIAQRQMIVPQDLCAAAVSRAAGKLRLMI
jgi:hypothetical protein